MSPRSALCILVLSLVSVPHAVPATARTGSGEAPAGRPVAPDLEAAVASLAALPLGFEINEGQAPSDVRFVARGRGHALYLTRDAAVFASGASTVRMRFGAPESVATVEALPGRSNYLIGND